MDNLHVDIAASLNVLRRQNNILKSPGISDNTPANTEICAVTDVGRGTDSVEQEAVTVAPACVCVVANYSQLMATQRKANELCGAVITRNIRPSVSFSQTSAPSTQLAPLCACQSVSG